MKTCLKCGKKHDGSFGSGKFCSITCANSRTFSQKSIEKKSLVNKGQIPWNKGVKWRHTETSCLHCGKIIKHWLSTPKKYHSDCWLKVSGGYRKGSGIGKKGWYKGFWCDSSYELAWVIYHIDHEIPFARNTKKYQYEWEGKIKNYIPDFICNGELIEIKGYVNEQTKAKIKSIDNLKVLFKKDLKKEFDYVESTYGKNFTELYSK